MKLGEKKLETVDLRELETPLFLYLANQCLVLPGFFTVAFW